MTEGQDPVIWRRELQQFFDVHPETMRRWIKAKKLPEPDVALSQRTMGWKLSTLQRAGINL